MHKVTKSLIVLGISLSAVGINAVYEQGRLDRQMSLRHQEKPESNALALPPGEIAAGRTDTPERIGEAGGVVLLTGEPAPGGVRLTWHLGGLSAPEGVRLARAQHVLPSANKDESVDAPAGSNSFLWNTPPGTWHFRVCLPNEDYPDTHCRMHSNDVEIEVLADAAGTNIIAVPDEQTVADWKASGGPLSLAASVHADGLLLDWSPAERKEFKKYLILRSETNPQPTFPADGYLASIPYKGFTKYIDRSVVDGISYYYRVCSQQSDNSVMCGNPIVASRN